jgi:hypothetical protein
MIVASVLDRVEDHNTHTVKTTSGRKNSTFNALNEIARSANGMDRLLPSVG